MAVADVLRRHAAHGRLGPGHQFVELLVAADVQCAKSLNEVTKVVDGGIAENLARSVLV
jgi:hypothetical protein